MAVERVDNIPAEYMWYDTSSGEYTDESGETPHEYVVYGTTAIHGDFGSCDEWELPLSIRKVWFGDSGNRPEDVSVDFSANLPTDMHIDETISLNESNNWLWRNLFKGIGAVYGRYVGEHLPIGWESIVVDVHVHGLITTKVSSVIANIPIEAADGDPGGYVLPSTGSIGAGGLASVGIALLAASVPILFAGIRKRRRR